MKELSSLLAKFVRSPKSAYHTHIGITTLEPSNNVSSCNKRSLITNEDGATIKIYIREMHCVSYIMNTRSGVTCL